MEVSRIRVSRELFSVFFNTTVGEVLFITTYLKSINSFGYSDNKLKQFVNITKSLHPFIQSKKNLHYSIVTFLHHISFWLMHVFMELSERSVLYNVREKSKIDCFPTPVKDLCLLNNVFAGALMMETLYDAPESKIMNRHAVA